MRDRFLDQNYDSTQIRNYGNTKSAIVYKLAGEIVLNATKREARQAFQSSWVINQNMFESTYFE